MLNEREKNFIKPTKFKFTVMIPILISMWCAGHLGDFFAFPIVQRTYPEAWKLYEEMEQLAESAVETGGISYINAAMVIFTFSVISKLLVSYLCSCFIIGMAERRNSTNPSIPSAQQLSR